MTARMVVENRVAELNSMAIIKRVEIDKLKETKANQDMMKIDNRKTRNSLRIANKDLTSIDNMLLLNQVVLATC